MAVLADSSTNSTDERIPDHIRAMINTLDARRLAEWRGAPGLIEAEEEAEEDDQYDEPGYTTDAGDSDGRESDGEGQYEEEDDRYEVEEEQYDSEDLELYSD